MDACDELGLFVIVNTPGWQFWNDEPIFAQRVFSDIRNMVRRDRNHPCVWMWEPILNETWYPADFAKNVVDILNEEYPYPYCYAGCDVTARGHEYFPIHFTHPINGGGGAFNTESLDPKISYYTREWGDNVDDWNSHNSPSRANRGWGEVPMLIQAQGYAKMTINSPVMMHYTELPDSIWAVASGIHSTTRGGITPIHSTEESWMLSDSLSYLIICSVPSVLPNPTKD